MSPLEGIPRTKLLTSVLIVLLAFIYLRFYLTYSSSFDVIQTSISDLEVKHLFEKSLIVINESIVDPHEIIKHHFRFLYLYKRLEKNPPMDRLNLNQSRYAMLYSMSNDTVIDIIHPKTMSLHRKAGLPDAEVPFVEMPLRDAKCMIIPNKWIFRVRANSQLLIIYLEDAVSLTIGKLF